MDISLGIFMAILSTFSKLRMQVNPTLRKAVRKDVEKHIADDTAWVPVSTVPKAGATLGLFIYVSE